MKKKLPIEIREGIVDDANFILNSWLKSYRRSMFACKMTDTVYYDCHHEVLRKLLKSCTVLVACPPNDPGQIYGYIVAEVVDNVPVIHFAYVKHTFRGFGICTALVNKVKPENAGAMFTHYTRFSDKLAAKFSLVYHPYLAFKLPKEK